jgi:hypothetical protein
MESEIKKLKEKIIRLEIENERLKLELKITKEEWSHPDSVLNKPDPWEVGWYLNS